MLGGPITLTAYLRWVARKPPGHKVSVEAWCKEKFDCRDVHVYPREIRCSFRNAWTDTYTPDEELRAFIGQVQRVISAGETLDVRLCQFPSMKGGMTVRCLKTFTSTEECQTCSHCPNCCKCREGGDS